MFSGVFNFVKGESARFVLKLATIFGLSVAG
jgi:hypothetical protein